MSENPPYNHLVDEFEKLKSQYVRAAVVLFAMFLLAAFVFWAQSLNIPYTSAQSGGDEFKRAGSALMLAFLFLADVVGVSSIKKSKIQFALRVAALPTPFLCLVGLFLFQSAWPVLFAGIISSGVLYAWAARRLKALDPDAPKPYANPDLEEYIRTHGRPGA